MITLTEDAWVEQYEPLPDPKNQGMGFDFGNGSCLVTDRQTFPHDVTFIWTVVETDGSISIDCGKTYVNSLGYIITEVPWPEDEFVCVPLDSVEESET